MKVGLMAHSLGGTAGPSVNGLVPVSNLTYKLISAMWTRARCTLGRHLSFTSQPPPRLKPRCVCVHELCIP